MRARPFIAANEAPRPYSELVAERDNNNAELRRIDALREEIARLEGEALEATDPADAKRLQCEAEGVRIGLDEEFARSRMR